MNPSFLVLFVTLGLGLDYAHGSDSSSSGSSSEDAVVDTPEVAQLKEQVLSFVDGLTEWISTGDGMFFESGEYFTDHAVFCSAPAGCAFGISQMPGVFGVFPSLLRSIEYINIKFTGVNPSLAVKSASFVFDDIIVVEATGCEFILPSRLGVLYFEGELASQFHLIDSDEEAVVALFDGFAPDAPSCHY